MQNPYTETKEPEARPISSSLPTITDLFGTKRTLTKKGKPASERSELLRYFIERAVDFKGPIVPARMGFMLSHISVQDLYAFKSILESETARPWPQDAGPAPSRNERWNRIFWGRLKVEKE